MLVEINCVFALALAFVMLMVGCLLFYLCAGVVEFFPTSAITVLGAIVELLLA